MGFLGWGPIAALLGFFQQNNRLHAARCDAAHPLVAPGASWPAPAPASCAVLGAGARNGFGFRLVGRPSGNSSAAIWIDFQPGGAPADCHPRRVVLRLETGLAAESRLQLPALGNQRP